MFEWWPLMGKALSVALQTELWESGIFIYSFVGHSWKTIAIPWPHWWWVTIWCPALMTRPSKSGPKRRVVGNQNMELEDVDLEGLADDTEVIPQSSVPRRWFVWTEMIQSKFGHRLLGWQGTIGSSWEAAGKALKVEPQALSRWCRRGWAQLALQTIWFQIVEKHLQSFMRKLEELGNEIGLRVISEFRIVVSCLLLKANWRSWLSLRANALKWRRRKKAEQLAG